MRSPRTHDLASSRTFAALGVRNFRLFVTAQLISNTGLWAQRVAQDWLVLRLTGSSAAVGTTMAMQFAPTLLFGLYGGVLADRLPRRQILLLTQTVACSLTTLLAALALTGHLTVAGVDLLAFGVGLVTAVDSPTRQSFVGELVGTDLIRNAVSLNSTMYQLGGLIGPAVAGVAIGAVGTSWVFLANALSYLPVLAALAALDPHLLHVQPSPPSPPSAPGQLREGLQYVRDRPHILWLLLLVAVVGSVSQNLPVVLTSFATNVFHVGPRGYGLMTSMVAGGSIIGALLSARRTSVGLRGVIGAGAALGALEALAAVAPDPRTFALLLVGLGAASLTFITGANTSVQLATSPAVRGRVMSIYLLVLVGSVPIGAPLVGLAVNHLGSRPAMLLSGLVPALTAAYVATRLPTRPAPSAVRLALPQQRLPSGGTTRLSR